MLGPFKFGGTHVILNQLKRVRRKVCVKICVANISLFILYLLVGLMFVKKKISGFNVS